MKTKLPEFIDFEKVNSLLEGFNKTTGFVTAILDLEGNVLSKSGWRQICTEFHRIHPETTKKCTKSDTELANNMAEGKKYHFYKCLNGLVDVAVPLIINEEHIANLFSGQFFFEKPDRDFFKKQAEKYGFDEKKYLQALDKVPVVSEEKVRKAMDFLLNMTQLISEITLHKQQQSELNKELKESEERHKSLFDSIRDAILVTNTNRKITQCNPAFIELFGYSKEEIIGKETSYIYKNLEEFKLMGQKIKENMDNPNFLLPVSYKKKNRTVFIGETNVFYLKNSKGEIEGFIGMIRDVTEKLKTEKALQQNEERFRKIVEGAPDPIFIQTEMKFSYLNPLACKLFGIKSQDELLGTPVMDRFHPDFHEEIYDRIHKLNVDRESVSKLFEQKFIRVDGSEVWVETVGEPIHYDEKDGALVFVRDITDRKEAEQKLKESEQKYRTVFENTGTATCILEKDGTISLTNTKFAQLAGYPIHEIENKKTWMEFVVPEDLDRMRQQHELRRKNRQEALKEYEFRFIDKNKKVKNIFLTIDVIPGTDKSVASLLDITEKVNAEKTLQQSEERFRNLFENMSSCVAVYQAVNDGDDFVLVDFNAAAEKAEKISENELLGKYVTEVFPAVKEFGLLDVFKRVWKTGKPEYHPVKEYKDNHIVGWRKNNVYKLPSGEIVALYDDVTKQRKAEMALKESEAQFRNLFETMAQGVVYQNDKGEITMANRAAEIILGLSFKQMIGKKSVDPEWRAVDKDKKELPGEKHPAMIALKTGKSVENFIQGIYNPTKKDYVWIITNSKPQFKKGSKKPYQVFSTFLDITDRKKAEDELNKLKENLESEVKQKTKELQERVADLERFQEATIEREFRIKELRDEIELLKQNQSKK